MKSTKFFIIFAVILLVPFNGLIYASMTSTNYEIRIDNISVGGSDVTSSTSYDLRSTVEISGAGNPTSSSYDLREGYREKIYDRVSAFSVFLQDNSSQVAATALNGSVVTVTDASGYAVDETIVIVQDEGEYQVAATGKIESISGSDLTLDWLTTGGATPTIDGGSDYVYQLDGSSLALGLLTPSEVATATIAWAVEADVDDGYDVYVFEDADLALTSDATKTLSDVLDGMVNAGDEEYGGRSSDTSLASSTFDTEDTRFTTSFQQIADREPGNLGQRDFMTVKAAMQSSTDGGDYSHTLTLIYVGDY